MTDPVTSIAGDAGAPNLAVDIQPDVVPGTFVWDESDWDSYDLLAWGTGAEGWQNIVCNVASVNIRRGATRQTGKLIRTEPGTLNLVIDDVDRQLDPTVNGEVVHANTPIRVRAWGNGWSEVLFTGRIASGAGGINVVYPKTGAPIVTIVGVDRVGPLASWKASGRPDPGVGGGDTLLTRLNRVLTEVGWPTSVVSPDIDTAYIATLASSNLSAAWDDLEDATDAELGRLWVDRLDRIVVRARDSQLSGPVRGTLSDVHDEIASGTVHCCYDDAQVVYGTELLVNRAVAGRRIPDDGSDVVVPVTIVQVDDEYSQARYGLTAIEDRSLELQTDGQLLPWGQSLVLGATEPELRVDSVSVAAYNAPAAWPQVAATDIGDRWAFRLHPELGPAVARTVGVLGIEHTITPEEWTCEWLTVTAPTPGDDNPSGWFTFDLSEWDSDDLLAPIGGTVTTT